MTNFLLLFFSVNILNFFDTFNAFPSSTKIENSFSLKSYRVSHFLEKTKKEKSNFSFITAPRFHFARLPLPTNIMNMNKPGDNEKNSNVKQVSVDSATSQSKQGKGNTEKGSNRKIQIEILVPNKVENEEDNSNVEKIVGILTVKSSNYYDPEDSMIEDNKNGNKNKNEDENEDEDEDKDKFKEKRGGKTNKDITLEKKKPLLILCHGLLCTKTYGIIGKLSEKLSMDTFAFDFRGNGESTGQWTLTGYDREVDDLRIVIEYFRSTYQDKYEILGILGHSKGSQCVLRYGRIYDDVPYIINLCGRFFHSQQPTNRYTKEQLEDLETKGWMLWNVKGKDYKINQEMMAERCAVDNTLVKNIANSKVLTIHGDADQTIPVADSYEWGKYISSHDLQIIPNAGHFFEKENEDKIIAQKIESYLSNF